MPEKLRKYKLNALALVVVLVVAYVAFAVATDTLPRQVKQFVGIKSAEEKTIEAFSARNSQQFITYTDENYGFTVHYPVGYAVDSTPEYGVQLAMAAVIPGHTAEVMEVRVFNETITEEKFNLLVDDQAKQNEVQFSGKKIFNGREVFLLNLRNQSTFTDEIIYTRQAFYNCRVPETQQAYSAAIVFLVPEVVAADLELADYVVSKFEC